MIKVVTSKKNRFGRSLVVRDTVVNVDSKGYAEVEESVVSQVLIAGFELVDKKAKFTSEEQKKHVAEVNEVLESAKTQAAAIISEAEKKAAAIISEAEKKAAAVLDSAHIDEREEKRQELSAKKVDELRALCVDAGIPEEKYEDLKKSELVELLISFIFDEN